MAHDVIDDLDLRLRAARPAEARPDADAFDAELLARVRTQPVAPRRAIPRVAAVPVAAGVTLGAAALVMLGGGPGDVGGPSSAGAITQALQWLTPPPHTILHVRSVETQGPRTTTRELWQSADSPGSERQAVAGPRAFETSGEALYDPATNTIYDQALQPDGSVPDPGQPVAGKPGAGKPGAGKPAAGKVDAGKPGDEALPVADPIVNKVRILLREGQMVVRGREVHDGTDAWAISLRPDVGRPVWTLWVSASDGRPLELRDPGRDASEQPQEIRWTTYEVLSDTDADRLLTLAGAHPSARVNHDLEQGAAVAARLMGPKG